MNKDITLFGVPLTVTFEPTEAELADANFQPRTEQISVRRLPIGKYNEAASYLDKEDEVGFTAVAIGRDKKWVESVTPETYDRLAITVQEVNQGGFFAYCGRRVGRRFGIEQAMVAGALASQTLSPTSSPQTPSAASNRD